MLFTNLSNAKFTLHDFSRFFTRHFKEFQKIWQYIQPASQPQTTCNHTSPGPPHRASSPPRSSETATWTAAATIGLHNQRISAQTARNHLREAHLDYSALRLQKRQDGGRCIRRCHNSLSLQSAF